MDALLDAELTELQVKRLYQKAVQLLTRREWGREELFHRLVKASQNKQAVGWINSPPVSAEITAAIHQVLDRLTEQGYLSELRFLTSYVTMRRQKGFGPLRITLELKQRGIPEAQIARVVETHAKHWSELARHLAAKKQQQAKTPIQQMRFLLSRGFSPEQARRAVNASIYV